MNLWPTFYPCVLVIWFMRSPIGICAQTKKQTQVVAVNKTGTASQVWLGMGWFKTRKIVSAVADMVALTPIIAPKRLSMERLGCCG